jgi:hypothetical protein
MARAGRSVAGHLRAGAATALAVGLIALVSCSSGGGGATTATPQPSTSTPRQYPPRAALFGDSLAWEAQPYYTDLVQVTGETALTYDSHGGTAICDWLSRMREVEAQYHPVGVQLEFSGNALTPCMSGYAPPSQAYYDKYRADTQEAIAIFAGGGARVFLIGAPITKGQQESDPQWDTLNRQYASIAAADPEHVTYVDAGTAVEGPGHTFVETLPCLPIEPCIGPVVGNVPSNTVRAPDGAHFCPVKEGDEAGVIGGCPIYSSGAYRYADAMVEAMVVPAGSTS